MSGSIDEKTVFERSVIAHEAARSAHHRLDRMNGSIDKLGVEVGGLRQDLAVQVSVITANMNAGFTEIRESMAAVQLASSVISIKVAVIVGVGALLAGAIATGSTALILRYVFHVGA